MLVTLAAMVVGLGAGAALGGRPWRAARLRWWGLAIPGVGLQALAAHAGSGGGGTAAQVLGLGCLTALALANRSLPGAAVAALGLAANAAVVGVDGGMPVAAGALVAAGGARPGLVSGVDYGLRHHAQRAGDHLTWLDDRWPLAAAHQVLSGGDILVVLGVAVAAGAWLRPTRLAGRGAPAAPVGVVLPEAHGAALLEVPVEAVEHRPGDRLLLRPATREPSPDAVAPFVAEVHQGPLPQVEGEEMYRSRYKWNPEPEFPERVEHRPGDTDAVTRSAGAGRTPPPVGEMDVDPAARAGSDGHQLDA